jgi:DUF1680 family protein
LLSIVPLFVDAIMTLRRQPSMTRRVLMKCLALSALTPRVVAGGQPSKNSLFGLAEVRLEKGPFAHSQAINRRYLLAHDVDRLLSGFRKEAGLEPRAAKYPNWESMGLDGHSAGHYLSALASEAATGDPELRRRLEYMLRELELCQRAHGDGYLGAVPNGRDLWKQIAAGRIDSPGFSLNGAWVPLYNVHKTLAGLRDAWLVAGNRQARDLLIRCADWCGRLIAKLDDEQVQAILKTEHGGMNEVLADVYAITGKPRYLALARRYSQRALLEPLSRREDHLDGLHANTQIPKVIGFARIGELSGDRSWIDAATFFWETVTERRSVAFGGNSVREHFNAANDFSSMLTSREGPETCNTYNMLRLTAQLYRLDPHPRYADYYERALFNHILSSQHPKHGGFVYFTPIRPRQYRVYSQPGQCFWCCVGTGMENPGKHGAFIYARGERSLIVNLYIASQLDWRDAGLTLRQETRFPDAESTELLLQLTKPRPFVLELRHPAWLSGPLKVSVNGREWPVSSKPSSYARIERTWHDGDRVEVGLPMTTRIERLPDGSDHVAVMHGPIVLAAKTGTEALTGLLADDGRGSHIAPGPYQPLEGAPMLVGHADALAKQIEPVPGKPLTFRASGLIQPASFRGLTLEPLFRTHDARYMVYWRATTPAAYPAVLARLEAQEKERQALEDRTLDQVRPGEQQPEIDHALLGEDMDTGMHLGRRWRDAGRWLAYRFEAPRGGDPVELMLTFFGGDRNDGFRLLVNERVVATISLDAARPDEFIDLTFPIPSHSLSEASGGITIKLAAGAKRTGRLFGARLMKAKPPR